MLINPWYSGSEKNGPKKNWLSTAIRGLLDGKYPPLGLAYIAGTLEKSGHTVKIIDAEADEINLKEIGYIIESFHPDLVGFTVTTWTLKNVRQTARYIKERFQVPTVIGGPHMLLFPEITLEFDEFDYGVIGEGEISICELVDAIERSLDFDNIQGIVYKKNGKIIKTGPRDYIKNLDDLPIPAWHLLPIDKYGELITKRKNFVTMISSRGCPFNCIYCDPEGRLGKKFRSRSPDNLMKEIELLYNDFDVREICFYDDTFTVDKERVNILCDEITARKLDLAWECRTRVNCVNETLIKKMADAGCYRIRFGVESGNERILKVLKKGITKDQVRGAFEWSKKYGIETIAYLMLGSPEESEETLEETINFTLELDPDYVKFSPTLTANPGSYLFKWAVEKGYTDPDYWQRFTKGEELDPFPILETDKLNKDTILMYTKMANQKFYFRPKFIIKTLKKAKDVKTGLQYSFVASQMLLRKFKG